MHPAAIDHPSLCILLLVKDLSMFRKPADMAEPGAPIQPLTRWLNQKRIEEARVGRGPSRITSSSSLLMALSRRLQRPQPPPPPPARPPVAATRGRQRERRPALLDLRPTTGPLPVSFVFRQHISVIKINN